MINEYVFDKYGLNHHEIDISINLVSVYDSLAKPFFRGIYHDYKKELTRQNDFIGLVHCVKGKGKIATRGEEFVLEENQALFVHYHNCVCFSSEGGDWAFYTVWFRVNNLKIELDRVYDVAVTDGEKTTIERMIYLLNTNEYLNCCKANTLAQGLILDILSAVGKTEKESVYADSMKKVALYVSQHVNENISVADLAAVCAFSRNYFFVIFKQFFKMSPKAYIQQEKIKKAAFLLLHTSTPIANIADELSFYSPAHFTSCFKKCYGVTPSEFRRQK
ncbi:MAG: helix-turn-helix transcriptional regulator [Clostridia bacterium]|nr:helix-turn-helix transcriptional regulator [Clostridia bacterium]